MASGCWAQGSTAMLVPGWELGSERRLWLLGSRAEWDLLRPPQGCPTWDTSETTSPLHGCLSAVPEGILLECRINPLASRC